MEFGLQRNWWALMIRGIVAIVLGVLALMWPGLTLFVLAALVGAWFLVDGIFAIVAAVSGHGQARHWWALLAEGILGVLVGIVTFFWPAITIFALVYLVAFWAIVTGVFEILAAIRLRQQIEGEWTLALGGILSVVLGIAFLVMPLAGAVALAWMIGAYAIAFGVLKILLGFQVRGWARHSTRLSAM